MTLLWRDPGAADAGASGKSVLTENTSPSIPPAAALQARLRLSVTVGVSVVKRKWPQSCRPVALRGHVVSDRGLHTSERASRGYVPENAAWLDLLTEPDPKRQRSDGKPRRNGRDPLVLPVDLLTASGHPRRQASKVLAAYRAGIQYGPEEGPQDIRTLKPLRQAICVECAGNSAEIRRCAIINCPIWPYRLGRNPHNPRRGINPFAEKPEAPSPAMRRAPL